MFRSKIGFRVVLTVVFSILLVEAVIGVFTVSRQKQAFLDNRLQTLQSSVSLLETVINHSLQHSRSKELTEVLTNMARSFNADYYALFDLKGDILIEQPFHENYQSHTEDLKIQLQLLSQDPSRQSQVLKGDEGGILREIVPVHNDRGDLMGGFEMETPMSVVKASTEKLVLETTFTVLKVSLLIALFVAIVLSRVLFYFVVKPVNAMRAELEQLSKGEADLTL
ncbi:MAG TPA: hypothetical protein VK859_15370, partial [bacterium]|nr:hypothetical protein [bacterium]